LLPGRPDPVALAQSHEGTARINEAQVRDFGDPAGDGLAGGFARGICPLEGLWNVTRF
jgi:hypothetical protein